jgi:hypothetical protein
MTKASTSLISISLATSEIREACAEAQAEGARSPFFLLVGAGISYPYVPLARDMVEHCKGKAREFGRDDLPAALDPLTVYMHWLDRAYPQPHQRRRYLSSLVQDKPLSHANFRLAHLLLAENAERLALTDLVVSAGFDEALERALQVFGKSFVLCDHPHAAARIDLQDNALKLVHLYGTHPFYDSTCLTEATAAHTQSQGSAPRHMEVLVHSILRERSPIVVGYSGWEQDLLMTALRRRLSGAPLQHNLYWFCYRNEDYEALPDWLKEHPNARFVRVQGKLQDEPATQDELEQEMLAEDSLLPQETPADSQPSLPARLIFEALIQEFDLPEPSVTQDPLQHFIRRLREVLPPRLSNDPYDLASVLGRLENLNGAVPVTPAAVQEPARPVREGVLEPMRQAVRRARSMPRPYPPAGLCRRTS